MCNIVLGKIEKGRDEGIEKTLKIVLKKIMISVKQYSNRDGWVSPCIEREVEKNRR